ncbi:hypothetical protein BRM22_24350, partial [Xanthomonas oryzae pv. oryzae]
MFTGWLRKFQTDRPLSVEERSSVLPRVFQENIIPSQRAGLVRINSSYLDWIDRRFLYRGMLNTSAVSLGALGFIGAAIFFVYKSFFGGYPYGAVISLRVVAVFALVCSLFLYFFLLRHDFFRYLYYPIRFNRKTRKIYVFREKRDGGLLIVPWEEVFFHIGRGTDMKFLRDIRGEILDGEIVKDTFALGHCAERDEPVKEMWEFIRRYMEEGPEAVAEHPLDKYVELSVAPTWKNCLISAVGFTNATTPFKRVLLFPFIGTFTVVRWLVFKSCKQPVFPPEVEAECQVEPNDPHIWPIPNSIGEFVTTVPGLMSYA